MRDELAVLLWLVHQGHHRLVVTLLRPRHHLAALVRTPGHGDPLAGGVLHELTGGFLHIAAGAARLVILPALLGPCLGPGAAPDQRVVAVDEALVLSHLAVADGAVLLVGLVTHLLLPGDELRGVGVVTLLNALVHTGQLGVLPRQTAAHSNTFHLILHFT